MKVLNIILLTLSAIFASMLTATVSASLSDDYCYDHKLEDSLCYEAQKASKLSEKMT